MSGVRKLSTAVQLSGVTAVVVFCFATIAVYLYARSLIGEWADVRSVPGWQSLLVTPAEYAFFSIGSAVAFFIFLYGTDRTERIIAIGYVAALALWSFFVTIHWITSIGGWHEVIGYHRFGIAIRAAELLWLAVLLVMLNPGVVQLIRRK